MESIRRFRQFVEDSWKELKRTSWPSQSEVVGTTTVVLLVTLMIALYLGVVDLFLAKIQSLVLFGGGSGA